jgi:signal transduction histidine kinase
VRLADYIESNIEPIMTEWVAFAATSGPAGKAMTVRALRDHAVDLLRTIVTDLRTPQTDAEQAAKSKGEATSPDGEAKTAAEIHGAGRAEGGFTVQEMVSEYRALRASVIRLWTKENGTLTGADLEDLIRFNETIDQAVAESVERYTENVDRAKEMFMAILGHDLRAPLSTVMTATQFVLETGTLTDGERRSLTVGMRCGRRMNRMIADLLDFTRVRLGAGLPISCADVDLGATVRYAVEEADSAARDRTLGCTTTGDLHGRWDAARISQVLSNLLGNAVQYSAPNTRISVSAQGEDREVIVRVHSDGTAIPSSDLPGLFSPFKRLRAASSGGGGGDSTNLGLGLFIAERIVSAHRGTIDVRSSPEAGTLFTVRLPR